MVLLGPPEDPRASNLFGKGRHVITVHEWDAHIFTWTCTCWNGDKKNLVGWGNAPYGWAQCEEQIEEHLEAHGQNKATRVKELVKDITERTRPLTKKERRERHEEEMDK